MSSGGSALYRPSPLPGPEVSGPGSNGPLIGNTRTGGEEERQENVAASATEPSASSHPAFSSLARRASAHPAWLIGLVLPLGLALLHEGLVRYGFTSGRLLPPPSKIFATLRDLAASGDLWMHVSATTWRVAGGFFFGGVAGVAFGALSGVSDLTRRLIDPLLQALRAIPSIAWVPLFILWFGIFETSKIVLIAVGFFFPVYLGVAGAILSVDRKIVEVGRVFRLSRLQLIWRVLLPAVTPATVIALRSGLGLGWMFVVAAEFMGASEGLGYLLVDGQQLGRPDQIMAALVIFASLGKATDALLVEITHPLLAWQDTAVGAGKEL
jgi:sulfonate transport system permease protein